MTLPTLGRKRAQRCTRGKVIISLSCLQEITSHNQFRAERAWDFSPEIGVLVIAGGENSSTYIDSVEMSNDLGDSFTELAPLPKSLKNGCLVIAGQTIFHAGGRTCKLN